MKIFSEIIGNLFTDKTWADQLKKSEIEYLNLDQWTAQKSRFIARDEKGTEYAVALKRHSQVENGDILEYNADHNTALVIRIELNPYWLSICKKSLRKNRQK